MWVGKMFETEKYIKAEEKRNKMIEIVEEFENHFGEYPQSEFILEYLANYKFFLKFGTKLITKEFGYCETCRSYIGTNPVARRLFNITILSSYCKSLRQIVNFNNRCKFWCPSTLYKQVILFRIEKMCGRDTEIATWLAPNIEDDY